MRGNEILAKTCMDALQRKPNTGSLLQRPMLEKMSDMIFMQDSAPAHTANSTQQWCSENLKAFWSKTEWPCNSPVLNPIETLWGILKENMEGDGQISTLDELIKSIKFAWEDIGSDILENLVARMPERIRLVLERNGSHINRKQAKRPCIYPYY